VTQGKVIRLLPPLIMSDDQVEYLAQQISLLLKELSQNYVEPQP
jgi:acetylornithine aminotransferase